MRKTLFSALSAFFAFAMFMAISTPAQAYHFTGYRWNPFQPTITVSDRNSLYLYESQAAYSWGSYADDGISMVYTEYETCSGCIKIYQGELTWPRVGQAAITYGHPIVPSTGEPSYSTFITACTITIDPYVATQPAAFRQAVVAHEIGHCLGFAHSPYTTDIMYGTADGNPKGPSSHEYSEMRAYYL